MLPLAAGFCLSGQTLADLQAKFDSMRAADLSSATEANEKAALGWGESYAMLAFARMYGATGDAKYADESLRRIVNVVDRRDDKRKVKDWRGLSLPCWRNVHYQLPQGVGYVGGAPEMSKYAYCYAVHSGMII